MCDSCMPSLRPWHDSRTVVQVDGDAEGLQLRCDLQTAACNLNCLDGGSRPELCHGAENDGL